MDKWSVQGTGAHIFRDIFHERCEQDTKWGVQDHNQMTWLGILSEEFGEAAKEVNELHFRPGPSLDAQIRPYFDSKCIEEQRKRLRSELVQVAAVAVAMIESLDRNGK